MTIQLDARQKMHQRVNLWCPIVLFLCLVAEVASLSYREEVRQAVNLSMIVAVALALLVTQLFCVWALGFVKKHYAPRD